MTAAEARLRRVCRVLDCIAALVPKRLADEEIGDAVEQITKHLQGGPCSSWWLLGAVLTTTVSVLVHAVTEPRAVSRTTTKAGRRASMFDRYVSGKRPSWQRRWLLIGSLGLHGAGAIALVVLSLAGIEELTPPPLAVLFSPAPQAQAANEKPRDPDHAPKKQPTPPVKRRALLQPSPIVEEPTSSTLPPIEDEKEPGSTDPSNSDGHGGGGGHGPDTGIGPTAQITPPAPGIKNVAAYQLDAAALFHPDPHLPDFVKAQGAGDRTFTAKVCVNQDGRIFHVDVIEHIPGADESVVSTIRTWQYKAQPIPVCFISSWVFQVR